jgi:hypothetical protein
VRSSHSNVWVGLILFFLLTAGVARAQLNPVRTALNRLQSEKWESAHRLLRKSLQKDSSNLEAIYVMARWYFSPGNPHHQLDSASYYTNRALRRFDTLTLREKERVQKFPIDSVALYALRSTIDSVAFERAKKLNTEAGYIQYIRSFPNARQVPRAIELRDEVAFLEALKINTYQSFFDYLKRYPQSHHAQAAADRYEKLLFEEKTKDRRLASFKNFLRQYPDSPYAGMALKNIFEISTASGEIGAFQKFMEEYPHGPYARLARDILFHLYKEREETMPTDLLTDSLKNVSNLETHYWIPFLKNNQYGFMDATGREVLAPQFDHIREEYKCGPVKDDILFLPEGYYSRSGKYIAPSDARLHAIGLGYMMLERGECVQLIHKSGWQVIADCYEDFYAVGNHFIAAERQGSVTLFTLTGRALPLQGMEEAEEKEGLIILTRAGKKIINTVQQLAALADGHPFQHDMVFDQVRIVDRKLLLVSISGMEGILSSDLKYVVPLDRHSLTKTSFGLIVKQYQTVRLRGFSDELESKSWSHVFFFRDWLVLQQGGLKNLYHIPSRKLVEAGADSVWFDKSLVFLQTGPLRKVYITAARALDLPADSKIHFIPSRDSVQFFFHENKKKRVVFSLQSGAQIFTTEFDVLESLPAGYFIVSNGSKKGVVDLAGKLVVPVEMEAIVLSEQYLSLLKDKKFGLFDMVSRKLIRPVYERNVLWLDPNHVAVFKEGNYGVMNLDGKAITDFEYSEIVPWRDSLIWVKKNFQWVLWHYHQRKAVIDQIRNFSWIRNTREEKIIRMQRENYFGVMSNRLGIVIPPSFTEIINLGTADEPLYFTEKFIEEAGIYIVVYYNPQGVLIRRHAYEEEEYDRILCDEH